MSVPYPELEERSVQTGEEPVGQLVGRLVSDLGQLFHDELELAKVEIKEEVAKSGKVAGLFGGTGIAAVMALLMLSFAGAWGLAEVIAPGWAFLCIAVIYAIAAAALFIAGRRRLAAVRPVPEQTVQTLKEDVEWARRQKS